MKLGWKLIIIGVVIGIFLLFGLFVRNLFSDGPIIEGLRDSDVEIMKVKKILINNNDKLVLSNENIQVQNDYRKAIGFGIKNDLLSTLNFTIKIRQIDPHSNTEFIPDESFGTFMYKTDTQILNYMANQVSAFLFIAQNVGERKFKILVINNANSSIYAEKNFTIEVK